MEHYPNSEPMRPHRRFSFTEFDKLCAEALDEDAVMAEESRALEEEEAWAEHDRVPGEIGGVLLRPSFLPLASTQHHNQPDPPEAA